MAANILLLEDDIPLACEIQAALAEIGCAVEIVSDGKVGLARAVSNSFDLVVAAIELPKVNGFRLCNQLKRAPATRATPVFLTTRETSAKVFEEHRRLSTRAQSYFHKPFMMAELVVRVRATLSGVSSGANANAVGADSDLLDDLDVTVIGEDAAGEATSERLKAAKSEVLVRLEREVEHWKARALAQGRGSGSVDGSSARNELAVREQLFKKDAELAKLRQSLNGAVETASELRHRIEHLEAERPLIEQSLQEQRSQNARLEKLLASARADKEQATRRAVDLSRRLERVRPEIEQAEQALAREQEARQAETTASARALAELNTRTERERVQADRLKNEENAGKDAAHARETSRLRAEHEAQVGELRRELLELRSSHEGAIRTLATREQELVEKKSAELGNLRAEHFEALELARRASEHEHTVARHEFEATFAKLKAQARQKIQELNAKLADASRDTALKVAEAREGFMLELAEERKRGEELQEQLESERGARSRDMAQHAQALTEASATLGRQRTQGEERELGLRRELAEALAARDREHMSELGRVRSETEEALAKALEAERQARTADAVVHAEELAKVGVRGEQERAEVEKSMRELEAIRVAGIEVRDAAARQDAVRLTAQHERTILALEVQIERIRAEAERTKIEAREIVARIRTELELKERVVQQTLANALAEAKQQFEVDLGGMRQENDEALATAREEHRTRIAELEAQTKRQASDAAESALAAGEKQVRELRNLETANHEAHLQEMAALEEAIRERESAIAELRAEQARQLGEATSSHEAELAQMRKAHDVALAAVRDRARSVATVEAQAELELELGQAMDALRAEFEKDRAEGIALMERAHADGLRRVMEAGDRERANLMVRATEREQALAQAEEALAAERQASLAEARAAAERIETLEALLASRSEDAVKSA